MRREPSAGSNEAESRLPRTWTRIWGVAGAIFLLILFDRLPAHLAAGDAGILMRDAGLALLCTNMIVQATKSGWPVLYSMSLSLIGVFLWLAGVLL